MYCNNYLEYFNHKDKLVKYAVMGLQNLDFHSSLNQRHIFSQNAFIPPGAAASLDAVEFELKCHSHPLRQS